MLLYADDTTVMVESPEELQKALYVVQSCCYKWDLYINEDETMVIIFSRGKVRNKPVFMYGAIELEIVDSYVYLGVKFNYNGKIKVAINQERKAMFEM